MEKHACSSNCEIPLFEILICLKFTEGFLNVQTRVKFKAKWLNKKFNSEQDKNLQSFYCNQLREANYLRPIMSDFERNYSIIQQLPQSTRKALAFINYNDNNAIADALENLDEIFQKNQRNFDRKKNNFNYQNQNNAECVTVAQLHTNNNYRGNSHGRGRGYSNINSRYNADNRNDVNTTNSSYLRNTLPDTRFPPPNYVTYNERNQNNTNLN